MEFSFGGGSASGLVGAGLEDGKLKIFDILITSEDDDQLLLSQLIYEEYYYLNDDCQIHLQESRRDAVNMRQYLTSPKSARRSIFKYEMNKIKSVGGLLGRFD